MVSLVEKIQQLKKRRIIKKIAAQEFEQARGKQHLELLLEAQQILQYKFNDYRNKIRNLEDKRKDIEQTAHRNLQKKLEYHIVTTRIYEIPGIGKTLGSSIVKNIYTNSIKDLRSASWLPGIGESKQHAINRWIRKYEREIPKLIKKDFPGKKALLADAAKKIFLINEEVDNLALQKERIREKLETINPWIGKLSKISREDFINDRINQQNNLDANHLFLNGIFGEWEPMPEWFVDVLNEANDV